ncbi:PREDICTED: ribosomal RNA-processing protein 8-like [Vollenhovia emeryi]|uniref:ribosomal RNA-processing protein 8-like n=1 Tax=Vollenhovia emeryi TaxID=411798 RepID=UPI0005F48274|nr:PREDICTED: ribosomal RNA-processing protein 8-like [Vollenhovia emeryi]
MAKFKRTQNQRAAHAVKPSIVKKRGKRKGPLNGTHKSNLKKLGASNEIATNAYANVQSSKKKKQGKSKNKFGTSNTEKSGVSTSYRENSKKNSQVFQKVQINTKQRMKTKLSAKDTERSDVPTKYRKNNKKPPEASRNVQVDTNGKTKRKKRNKRNVNVDRANAAAVDNARERGKGPQAPAKNLNLERRKTQVEKLETISGKKMKRISAEVESQRVTPDETLQMNRCKINIQKLKEMLARKSQPKPKTAQLTLRDRMMAQLKASRFRYINEILYDSDSSQSKRYFKTDPDAFVAYHAGYKQQLAQWAVNPLDVVISSIKNLPTDNVIADFGCGEARLAACVPHTVHSFDFVALNDRVKACDMAHTPLLMNSVHVVVFCLSLMGSNLNDYIMEANRVLKNNGLLKIAEVESRFENVKDFIRALGSYGFKSTWKDLSHNLFYFMDFRKEEDIIMKKKTLPSITLKSCLYKKR